MGRISRILTTEAAAEPPAEMVDMESDFVVILAALLCALICVVGMIAVARCAWLRRGISSVASRSSSQLTAAANRGVKKKNLQLLPKFTYSAATATTTPSSTPAGGMFAKFASTECAICLGEFVEGDEVRVLPQCGHGFHVGCIDTWLGSHSSCPSCRRILVMTRCQKCGQFAGAVPAASSAACGGGNAPEPELRGTATGESNNRCDNNNDSVNVSSFLP